MTNSTRRQVLRSSRALRILVATGIAALSAVGLAVLPSTATPPTRPITWLAAGDSYSSGEGLPHSTGGCAQADGTDSQAYAQVAYDQVQQAGTVPLTGGLSFVACTGALTSGFFATQGGNPAEWSGGQYDLVTFTFGGDDIDFPDVIKQCIGLIGPGDSGYVTPDPGNGHQCPADATLRQRIQDDLTDKYRTFLTNVATNAVNPGGNIVVLGYPELVEDPNLWTGLPQFVDLCQGISRADADELRGLAGDLNATIGEDVVQTNAQHPNGVHITFINVNSGGSNGISSDDPRLFEPSSGTRHNLCSADSWVNGISTIDYFQGSFHPKQAGLDAEGSMLAQVIDNELDWTFPLPPPATTLPPISPGPLSFVVTGTCTSDGGTLIGQSSGFTPGGRYTVTATRPDGQDYPLGAGSAGTVNGDGSIVWRWPCQGDPSGTYNTVVVDTATGRSSGAVPFAIGVPAAPITPPTTRPPTSAPPSSATVVAYDNYGTATTPGLPICRGNPARPESMPGGTVSQAFSVGGGISALNQAEVQIDPDPTVTATATLTVNGTAEATTSAAAAGDTYFNFPNVAVATGDQVTLSITFTATYGKIITVYEVGNPPGNLTVSDRCTDGASNVDTTATGLRAKIVGVS